MDKVDLRFPLFEDLVERGFSSLAEIVEQKREETLHLEFKTLSSHDAANLAKNDRKLIARSICGLCNAEGGLLLLGVETTKLDGVDVAAALKRFENVDALHNRIVSALPEMLSPQHPQVAAISIRDPSDQSTGFIAIHVPASDA